ncbi:MAG TPA: FAD-binding oxidoreductase [Nitrososphaerales archaeon]|nr:FAD-binding oxidoreductase [Nitrososphaerales archaeon]
MQNQHQEGSKKAPPLTMIDPESLVQDFAQILGIENVIDPRTRPEKLEDYLKDMGDYPSNPLLILQPKTNEQVSAIVSLARKNKIPIVARGAGTSLTGATSTQGGITIDFSKNMDKILKIDTVNWYVHCQAGVVLEDLNNALRSKGFFFPPDPSSSPWCTVGGAVSENSGGMRCFRYGTVEDWVYSLRVVLSDGSIATLGEPLPKNRAGYDLVHLLCGSEGTLALITEAWLKIAPFPKERKSTRMLVFFDDWKSAGRSIQKMREERIQPILLEFLDGETVRALNVAFEEFNIPEHEATLFIETDGSVDEILKVCGDNGSSGNYIAKDEQDGERLYSARALVYLGIRGIGLSFHTEDVVVPIDRLIDYLEFLKIVSKKYGVRIPTGGHAGDGNVHPIILYDESSKEATLAAKKAFEEICSYAIEVGGSVTGEHGIGEQKIDFALAQLNSHGGTRAYGLMKEIKKIWDPDNIFNPGKFLKMSEEEGREDALRQ